MEQEVRVVKGPIAPPEGLPIRPFEYRPIFAVYLECGMLVTRSDGFPQTKPGT